jgi:hypothetical protein
MSTTQTTSLPAGIVVSTAITAGGASDDCPIGTCNGQNNHVEGVVVSTAITAGAADCPTGTCNDQNNHAEGLVRR